jgi:hypothetical protein
VKYFTHGFRHSWYGEEEDTEIEDTFGREA